MNAMPSILRQRGDDACPCWHAASRKPAHALASADCQLSHVLQAQAGGAQQPGGSGPASLAHTLVPPPFKQEVPLPPAQHNISTMNELVMEGKVGLQDFSDYMCTCCTK